MESNLVVYDVGSTYTKVLAYSIDELKLELCARGQVPTSVDNIFSGIEKANKEIESQDCSLSKERLTLATSSAAGGLRMVAMGYMPRVTAKAAKEVSMNAGARVLEIVTYEDPPEYRVEILSEIRPDIILLAGGTDGGDRENLIENAELIISSGIDVVVIIAGNIAAQSQVEKMLTAVGVPCKRVANVMPTIHELKVTGARNAIHEEFIKQISFGKGLKNLVDIVTDKAVIPTPGAILMAAELLASGTYEEEGIGDLIIIDVGGATTDIHSILPSLDKLALEEKGLVVTNEKQKAFRTVEGNLGMRISATGILDTLGAKGVVNRVNSLTEDDVENITTYAAMLEEQPDHIAADNKERAFDRALAVSAIEIALKRHAGHIAQEYDPVMGISPGTPMGRDLRRVRTIIAVGGIFTYSSTKERESMVRSALQNRGISLLPESYEVFVDESYLLYSIGVLSKNYPDVSLRFLKKYLKVDK